jgi:hypothetical protein
MSSLSCGDPLAEGVTVLYKLLRMPWLIVLGEATAARWVLDHQRMAFRTNVLTRSLEPDAPIALYVTRGAFGKSLTEEAQIVAIGRVASPVVTEAVEVAGRTYERWRSLEFEAARPLRQGLPFRPLR